MKNIPQLGAKHMESDSGWSMVSTIPRVLAQLDQFAAPIRADMHVAGAAPQGFVDHLEVLGCRSF